VKFLVWILVVLAVAAWLMRDKTPARTAAPPPGPVHDAGAERDGSEQMVQCAHCKTYVPVSESVHGATGAAFCGEEHRRLGESRA
jgi:hypothetical protein